MIVIAFGLIVNFPHYSSINNFLLLAADDSKIYCPHMYTHLSLSLPRSHALSFAGETLAAKSGGRRGDFQRGNRARKYRKTSLSAAREPGLEEAGRDERNKGETRQTPAADAVLRHNARTIGLCTSTYFTEGSPALTTGTVKLTSRPQSERKILMRNGVMIPITEIVTINSTRSKVAKRKRRRSGEFDHLNLFYAASKSFRARGIHSRDTLMTGLLFQPR